MFIFLGWFMPEAGYQVAYARPVSYYAVYTIVFAAWIIAFVVIVYQIRTGPKTKRKVGPRIKASGGNNRD